MKPIAAVAIVLAGLQACFGQAGLNSPTVATTPAPAPGRARLGAPIPTAPADDGQGPVLPFTPPGVRGRPAFGEPVESSLTPAESAAAAQTQPAPELPPGLSPSAPPSNVLTPPAEDAAASRRWFNLDGLFWWVKNGNSPSLVISQPGPSLWSPTVHVPTSPGFIGLVNFSNSLSLTNSQSGNLFGDTIHNDLGTGARFTLGSWMDSDNTFGIEGRFLSMQSFTSYSPGAGIAGIPYRDSVTGQETAYLVNTSPGYGIASITKTFINTTPDVFVGLYTTTLTQSGSILNIQSSSLLRGGEANSVFSLARTSNWHAEGIVGFRFVELDESLLINTTLNNPMTTVAYEPALGLPAGSSPVLYGLNGQLSRSDSFQTFNSFYGGQVGVRGEYSWGNLSLSGSVQAAVGDMQQTVSISGVSSANGTLIATPTKAVFLAGIPIVIGTGPAVSTKYSNTYNGGLFAQPTNSGKYSHNCFAVVPEGLLNLHYKFTPRISGTLGYTFFYISNVARPGDQIDRNTTPASVMPPSSPASASQPGFQFHTTDYWGQGINVGFQVRF